MIDLNNLNESILKFGRPMKRRKILLLGSECSGKSSLIKRFKDNIFEETYEPTIQNNIKKLFIMNNESIELEIIDFEGQTEFTIYTPNKFSFGINGYMLVYEITNKKSFELIKIIKEKLDALVGKKFPKILIGTKCDFDSNLKREVSFYEGLNYSKEINCPFLESSSKNNINVDKGFLTLLIEINKIETGFEPKSLNFYNIISCFVRKENLMTIIFYFLFFLMLFLGLYWVYFGINKEMNALLNERGLFFFLIIYGFWIFIFSLIGICGLKNKSYEKLNLNKNGNFIAIIIIITGTFYYYNYNQIETKKKMKEYTIIISIILNLINIVFSIEFKIIYELDLLNYII